MVDPRWRKVPSVVFSVFVVISILVGSVAYPGAVDIVNAAEPSERLYWFGDSSGTDIYKIDGSGNDLETLAVWGSDRATTAIEFSANGSQIALQGSNGRVRVVDASNGSLVWEASTEYSGGTPDESLDVTSDGVYAAHDQDVLVKYDRQNGTEVWNYSLTGDGRYVHANGDFVWGSGFGSEFVKLHESNGTEVFNVPTGDLVVDGDYAGNFTYLAANSVLEKRRSSDGSLVWNTTSIPGTVAFVVTGPNDNLYVLADLVLYKIDPSDGSQIWSRDVKNLNADLSSYNSLGVHTDGTVYLSAFENTATPEAIVAEYTPQGDGRIAYSRSDSITVTQAVMTSGGEGGGSSSDDPEGEYDQTFVLDNQTDMVTVQGSELTAYWWDVSSVLEPGQTNLSEGDRCLADDALNGWVLCSDEDDHVEGSTGFNFRQRGIITVRDENVYRFEVYDKTTGGFHVTQGFTAEKTVSDRPEVWWDNPFISDGIDSEEGEYVIIVDGVGGTIDSGNQYDADGDGTDSDDPYLEGDLDDDGDWNFNYSDPTGNTTHIEYEITCPDGQTYTFNRTFDDPIGNFSAEIDSVCGGSSGDIGSGGPDGIDGVDIGFTTGGDTAFDTVGLNFSGSEFGEAGFFGPPSGGSDGINWWWILIILAILAYVFRDEIEKLLRQ